jgi:hypothetical protein
VEAWGWGGSFGGAVVWLCTNGGVCWRRLGPNGGSAVFCLSSEFGQTPDFVGWGGDDAGD